jgi:hypothetical protein
MRADNIKTKYMSTGVFKDDSDFNCGSVIKSEMERDISTMKDVVVMLNNYKEGLLEGYNITICIDRLNERIKKFD